MSQHAYVEGWYDLPTEDALEGILAKLRHGGWLDEDFEEDEIADRDALILRLPGKHYRNLHRHVDDLGDEADDYRIVSASTDGCFTGWVDAADETRTVDLEEWAAERDFDDPPAFDDFENYVEWSEEVMDAFVEEHATDPPVPA